MEVQETVSVERSAGDNSNSSDNSEIDMDTSAGEIDLHLSLATSIDDSSDVEPISGDRIEQTSGEGSENTTISKKSKKEHRPIQWEVLSSCFCKCNDGCLQRCADPDSPVYTIALTLRQDFVSRTVAEQKRLLVAKIRAAMDVNTVRRGGFHMYIGDEAVCKDGWARIAGQSTDKITRTVKEMKQGLIEPLPSNTMKTGLRSMKVEKTMRAFREFRDRWGDRLPDRDAYYLPACLTRKAVYGMIVDDMKKRGQSPCTMQHFLTLWKRDYKNVTIPRNVRLGKCDKCSFYKNKLEKIPNTKENQAIIQKYKEERLQHLKVAGNARAKYYKHNKKAIEHPDKYLSLIIDGMDQNKTELPHAGPNGCKAMNGMFKLKTHVMGAISHGTKDSYVYIDFCQFPHGSNLTVHVLLDIISKYAVLPPVLYLQLDNCGGDNKNRFVLGLLCLLVEMGVFRKVKLGFLMVGHTHEDIDQCFSCFSRWLNKHPAYTIEEMVAGFEAAYTPTPTTVVLEDIFDFKDWVTPHLNELSGHFRPHHFKITRNENGKAVIVTKAWCTDPEWSESIGSCDGVFLKSIPDGVPSIVPRKSNETEVARIKKDLEAVSRTITIDSASWTRLFLILEVDEGHLDADMWRLTSLPNYSVPQRLRNQLMEDENMPAADDLQCPPLIIGKMPAILEADRTAIEINSLTAIYTAEKSRPWIGRVVKNDEHNVIRVHWLDGAWTTQWKDAHRGKGKNRVAYEDNVERDSVVLWDFKLTKTGRLKKNTVDELKRVYAEHDELHD